MSDKRVILKPGREKALNRRHPWIFSGAIATFPKFQSGEILSVFSSSGQFLAKAYFHETGSLSGRVLTFHDEEIPPVIRRRILQAKALRDCLKVRQSTTAYRLINAEGDGLPGLIVDVYDGILVIQVSTCGMEALKALILEELIAQCQPKAIYEKSTSRARLEEGLDPVEQLHFGEMPPEVLIEEHGVKMLVDVMRGQKTGYFIDQRPMRHLVGQLAKGKRVLNCFAFSGGFSLAALKGGATHVTSVDQCPRATALNAKNTSLNHCSSESHRIVEGDVFEFLSNDPMEYDLIILDPPAFAKRQKEVKNGCQGYKRLNRMVLERAPADSLLLTCSCSHVVSEGLFSDVIAQAAAECERDATIVTHHHQAFDHPTSLFHPEGAYLKSLLLYLHSR